MGETKGEILRQCFKFAIRIMNLYKYVTTMQKTNS